MVVSSLSESVSVGWSTTSEEVKMVVIEVEVEVGNVLLI